MPFVGQLIETIKELLEQPVELDGGAEPSHSKRRAARSESKRTSAKSLTDRGSEKAATTGSVLAGSIELVGLAEIKRSLGHHWDALAKRAVEIAEEEVARYVSPEDVVQRYDDETFIICFSTDDDRLARSLAEHISTTISERIRSELTELREVSATSLVVHVDADKMSTLDDPLEYLCKSLRDVASEAVAVAQDKTRPAYSLLRQVPVVFQPMWATNAGDPTINRCLFGWYYQQVGKVGALPSTVGMAEAQDCVLLTRAVEQLHGSFRAHRPVRLLVTVHFSTLDDPQARHNYFRLVEILPNEYRQHLMLEVQGVPAHTRAVTVAAALEAASEVTRHVVLRTTHFRVAVDPLVSGLLCGLSIDVRDAKPVLLNKMMLWAKKLEEISDDRIATFVSGANSILKAKAAWHMGVSHISGPAIYQNLQKPYPSSQPLPVDKNTLEQSVEAWRQTGS